MRIKLLPDQRFLIPLEDMGVSYLIVKEIDFLGANRDHNIPQIHYIGTLVSMDIESIVSIDTDSEKAFVEVQKNYTLVIDEEYNCGFLENE